VTVTVAQRFAQFGNRSMDEAGARQRRGAAGGAMGKLADAEVVAVTS
jgi:hypothetical protein